MNDRLLPRPAADRLWRTLFILYAVALSIGTHWPELELGTDETPAPDKLIHMFAFSGLTILLWRTRWLGDRWLLLGALIVWAAIDEWTQGLPWIGRNPNHADMFANWLGILLAFTWIQALQPAGGPLNRMRLARSAFTFDALLLRKQTWLTTCPIALAAALLVSVGAAAVAINFESELVLSAALLGAAAGGAAGAYASLERIWVRGEPSVLESRPCFTCWQSANGATFDQNGLTKCKHCDTTMHEAQWRLSLDLTRGKFWRDAAPAAGVGLLLVVAMLVFYVLIMLLTVRFSSVRSMFVAWVPMPLRLVIDLAVIGLILAASFRVLHHRIARRFDEQHRVCRHCRHDLSKTPTERGVGRCGECGTEFVRLPDPLPALAGSD